MSLFRLFPALGVFAIAAGAALSAQAQTPPPRGTGFAQIPPGSYQQTCREIRVERDTLRAQCLNMAGQRVASVLNLATCRDREVDNANGVLRCGVPVVRPTPAPPGSYSATCRDAIVRGTVLSARCTTRTGALVSTSLDLSTCRNRDIVNINGGLTCGGPIVQPQPLPRPPLPPGAYQTSCRDLTLRGNLLTGRCTTRAGGTLISSLDLSTCRVREVANDNGVLRCAPQRPVLPVGPYQSTCRDAVLRGDVLTARCNARNGTTQVSSISVSTCRTGEIVNANGVLRCDLPGRGDGRGDGRGRGGREDFEAVIYTRPNFRGQQLLVSGPIADLRAQPGFNDTIRSIRILRGEVMVCADPQFRGRCEVLAVSNSDVATIGMAGAISSIRGEDRDGRGRGRN